MQLRIGLLSFKWVDKEKALNWFSSASPNVRQKITNKELSDATKLVKKFENPKAPEAEIASLAKPLTSPSSTSCKWATMPSVGNRITMQQKMSFTGTVTQKRTMSWRNSSRK